MKRVRMHRSQENGKREKISNEEEMNTPNDEKSQ
jgi:hypothetical protein